LADGDAQVKKWVPPKLGDARAYLAGLAGSLLSDGNSYFLPFESIDKFWDKLRTCDDETALEIEADFEEMRLGSSPCSSDYGPVRNVRDLDPPDLKTIRWIIEERYEPIAAIFEKKAKANK
jgi:hypothetical protein